jgi:sugar phosphate isomerase/epimerase
MTLTRRQMLAACAAAVPALYSSSSAAPAGGQKRLGIVIHSFPVRRAAEKGGAGRPPFGDPLNFLEYCRKLGAGGVQVSIGVRDRDYVARLRTLLESSGMYLEGSIRLPQDRVDVERFNAEVQTARDAGATVLRTAILSGRRYETFDSAEAFRKFAERAYASLGLAEPIVAKHVVRLAVENHKDWRTDELLDMLRRLGSRQVGVCVDTGNSIALLEDPLAVVEAYAPLAFSTHLKDMGVTECEDGFLLSEVPLGTGFLDLKKMVEILRKAQPGVRFNLEMITRDPLRVPCLTPKYWATFESLPGRRLADALARVRKHAAKQPLPRVSHLSPEKKLEVEDENIRQCLAHARKHLEL